MLFPAPFRAHFRRSIQKNLQLGFGKNDSSDVAPFHHDAATGAGALLLGNEHFSHFCNRREARRGLCNLSRPNFVRYVLSIQKHTVLRASGLLLERRRLQLDVRLLRQRHETGFIVKWDGLSKRLQRERSIHGSAVEIQILEHRGNAPRHAALPRTRRAVNGNCKSEHFRGTATPGYSSFGRQERHAELRHESRAQWKFVAQYQPQFCPALLTANCRLFTYSKPHDVVAAIDEDRLAGNARARFRKQECSSRADLGGIDVTL